MTSKQNRMTDEVLNPKRFTPKHQFQPCISRIDIEIYKPLQHFMTPTFLYAISPANTIALIKRLRTTHESITYVPGGSD